MYPHERSLVKQFADRPFVLLGVNADPEIEGVRKMIEAGEITWRSFWNGPLGSGGPISMRWNVTAWPTLYLIDHRGVIRRKWRGSPGPEELEEAVAALVMEAERAPPEGAERSDR